MDMLNEEEEYNWREVTLPTLIPIVPHPGLGRDTGERRRGCDIIIAVDHGPNSKHAFDWALVHLCRLAHAVSSVGNETVYQASQNLMEKLAVETLLLTCCREVRVMLPQCEAAPIIIFTGAEAGEESVI